MTENDMLTLIWSAVDWVAFSIGLHLVLKKLGEKKSWLAWIPGVRFFKLGQALGMSAEGILCGLLEVLLYPMRFYDWDQFGERFAVAASLILMVLIVIRVIYELRLFLRVSRVFGAKKGWLLLWIFFSGLTMLYFGASKKRVPLEIADPEEGQKAGTAPAAIAHAAAAHHIGAGENGLSVDLRERTVSDFGKKRYLLKDISLDIPNGSMVLLLGGSGSGKTTLVNAVIGYEKADAEILLNGKDIYRDYGQMKYRIGFVPQKNLIRGNDTVIRTVTDAAELRLPAATSRKERGGKVGEVMDLLGLSAGADGLVCKKSGGQLRRISIAMELVTDPELFVLDEPDSGLDGVIAREIFTKLRGIADSGKIVIVITHTPDRVIDLFDKVIVLARDSGRVGRLAFYGSPDEAKAFFGKETMEGIVMSVNRREEGGDGLADHFVERFARERETAEEEAVS